MRSLHVKKERKSNSRFDFDEKHKKIKSTRKSKQSFLCLLQELLGEIPKPLLVQDVIARLLYSDAYVKNDIIL